MRFLGRESGDFEVKSGLRQGDALFPILFNMALEKVVRDMHETRGMDLTVDFLYSSSKAIYIL